jgi:hypothetical protein
MLLSFFRPTVEPYHGTHRKEEGIALIVLAVALVAIMGTMVVLYAT